MSIDAMKLALEALDNLMYWDNGKPDYDEAREAITALRQAIKESEDSVLREQAQKCTYPNCDYPCMNLPDCKEQEPVGQLCEETYGRGQVMWFNKPADGSYVYTSPPQRQPLTDERCVGCEACIDSACGREDCPKGWKESASVAYIRGLEDGARQNREPLTDEKIINEADRFDWDKDCAVRFARAIEAAHGIKGEA